MLWKKIKSTNNLYEASSNGDIRRVKGLVVNSNVGGVRTVGGKALSQKTKSNGYMEVSVYYETKSGKSRYVHRLVAEAFIFDIPPGYVVNHKDGNKSNNNIENLEVVTPSQNSKHAYDNGLSSIPIMKGEQHPNSKLKKEDVISIRADYKNSIGLSELSARYNTPKSTICKVVYNQTWKHLL